MTAADNRQIWYLLSHQLTQIIDESAVDDEKLTELLETRVKEVSQLIKEIKKCQKEKTKCEAELSVVDKAIDKANANIARAEAKSAQVQEYIDKISKKSDENKENIENVMNVWNTIGLRMEKKDNSYSVRFSKIANNEPNKWFSVKFTIDGNRVQLQECEPKDSLDLQLVEQEFAKRGSGDAKPDLRLLIALIRNNLKKKNN